MNGFPRVVFRADASPDIGAGHVMRCQTLAFEFAELGWGVIFASRQMTPENAYQRIVLSGPKEKEPEEIAAGLDGPVDLLVVDTYEWQARLEQRCRRWANKILVIDDLANRKHDCDVLMDQTLGRSDEDYASLTPSGARLMMGVDYALIRREFRNQRSEALARRNEPVKKILVSIGGTDTENLVERILTGIAEAGLDVVVDLAISDATSNLESIRELIAKLGKKYRLHLNADNMAQLMKHADLSIGAAGGTSWERCCMGLPSVIVVRAENQQHIAKNLSKAAAVLNLGNSETVTSAGIGQAIKDLSVDRDRRVKMSQAAAALCDGSGVRRVIESVI
jgi:UDP-2,4-diacetamido-2,4,6-trideoxy-beta-L-altropyranose hydrolase